MSNIIIPKTEVKRLTSKEIERAMRQPRTLYPDECPCTVCGFRWMQHKGTLCPARPGYLDLKTGSPVPPTLGDTEFIPDEAFFAPPDFDVV